MTLLYTYAIVSLISGTLFAGISIGDNGRDEDYKDTHLMFLRGIFLWPAVGFMVIKRLLYPTHHTNNKGR